MKKFILAALISMFTSSVTLAQSSVSKKASTYETAMLANIRALDTASKASSFISLANNFDRIGNAEKTKWEPFYYASYCYTAIAFLATDKSAIDGLADEADAYLQKAGSISKNNSEITCLAAMINSCRLMVDPAGRFQTKGKEINLLLSKAKEENAANPRIYLLQARILMRTPEVFGGGKIPVKAAAETAVKKFIEFKCDNAVAPAWGEAQATALLNKLNEDN